MIHGTMVDRRGEGGGNVPVPVLIIVTVTLIMSTFILEQSKSTLLLMSNEKRDDLSMILVSIIVGMILLLLREMLACNFHGTPSNLAPNPSCHSALRFRIYFAAPRSRSDSREPARITLPNVICLHVGSPKTKNCQRSYGVRTGYTTETIRTLLLVIF